MNKQNDQTGSGHLILFSVIFVALVGVLGYVGYNAWQRQQANAGGENTIASKGPAAGGISCTATFAGIDTKYRLYGKLTIKNLSSSKKKAKITVREQESPTAWLGKDGFYTKAIEIPVNGSISRNWTSTDGAKTSKKHLYKVVVVTNYDKPSHKDIVCASKRMPIDILALHGGIG